MLTSFKMSLKFKLMILFLRNLIHPENDIKFNLLIAEISMQFETDDVEHTKK